MPIHYTLNEAATLVANKWVSYQEPQINGERRRQIVPIATYNLLATAFNASTVLIIAAVVSTLFYGFAASVALGAIGVFLRLTAERGINHFALPQQDEDVAQQMTRFFRTTFGMDEMDEKEARAKQIFVRLGIPRIVNWNEDEVYIGLPLWKNSVPIPV